MSNILDGMNTEANISNDKDSLGGFSLLPTDVHLMGVEVAYMDVAASGAISVSVHLRTPNKEKVRITEYVTSGTAKGCKNYYVKQDGTKHYLPGYNKINALCKLTTGKNLAELNAGIQVRGIKLYDKQAGKETVQNKEVIVPLVGVTLEVGIFESIVDINVQNQPKVYSPSGYSRKINEVDKFFEKGTGLTINEKIAGETTAIFKQKWLDAYKGEVQDRTEKKIGLVPKPKNETASTAGIQQPVPPVMDQNDDLFGD